MSAQCELYEDLLVAEALGDISEKERMFLKAHLEGCGRCRSRLAAVRDTIGVMTREHPEAAPAGLAERTLRRVEVAGERFVAAASPYHETMLLEPSTWRVRRSLVGWMVAASILVMAVATLVPGMLGGGGERGVEACQEHMKTLAVALKQYALDHNGNFPQGADWYRALDYDYLHRSNAFLCPARLAVGRQSDRETDYVYNPSHVSVTAPDDYPLLWDSKAAHDQLGRNVLFADGKVSWVAEDEFTRLLAKYKIDEMEAIR